MRSAQRRRLPALLAGLLIATAGSVSAAPSARDDAQPTVMQSHVYVDDYCVVRDVLTPYRAFTDHDLTVLDWTYAVSADYAPPDLAQASAAGFGGVSGTKLVRQIVLADLVSLRSAAAVAGHAIEIQSAYRSYATQQETFEHWVSQVGYEQALQISARPGHSEHQLGTTIDFTSGGIPPWRYADWGATPAGAWMAENAWRYGFVMSYPPGSEAVACYNHEPWHFRWIGRYDARAARASGLVLRQYLEERLHAVFVDIRFTSYEGDVTWAVEHGITDGCTREPARYCPELDVTRSQMASLLARALDLQAGADVDAFADDDGSIHEANINRLAYAGLTAGCDVDRYCPESPMRRDQMASFLARALDLQAGAEVDAFADDDGSIHEANINRLAYAGITAGCGDDRFCPTRVVGRDQMAAFLHRALR